MTQQLPIDLLWEHRKVLKKLGKTPVAHFSEGHLVFRGDGLIVSVPVENWWHDKDFNAFPLIKEISKLSKSQVANTVLDASIVNENEGYEFHFQQGSSSVTFFEPILPHSEQPGFENLFETAIDHETLNSMKLGLACTSKDECREALRGVFCSLDDDLLVSTNGRILVAEVDEGKTRWNIPAREWIIKRGSYGRGYQADKGDGFTIPSGFPWASINAKNVQSLVLASQIIDEPKLYRREEKPIIHEEDPIGSTVEMINYVGFKMSDGVFVLSLVLEKAFPNYSELVEGTLRYPTACVSRFNNASMIEAVQNMKDYDSIGLNFGEEDSIKLCGENSSGSKSVCQIASTNKGFYDQIKVNPSYLLTILKNGYNEIHIISDKDAAILKKLNGSIALIMPIRLTS